MFVAFASAPLCAVTMLRLNNRTVIASGSSAVSLMIPESQSA
jgi:hypothetical protein